MYRVPVSLSIFAINFVRCEFEWTVLWRKGRDGKGRVRVELKDKVTKRKKNMQRIEELINKAGYKQKCYPRDKNLSQILAEGRLRYKARLVNLQPWKFNPWSFSFFFRVYYQTDLNYCFKRLCYVENVSCLLDNWAFQQFHPGVGRTRCCFNMQSYSWRNRSSGYCCDKGWQTDNDYCSNYTFLKEKCIVVIWFQLLAGKI